MEKLFIGRKQERQLLQDALKSHEAEIIAVIGFMQEAVMLSDLFELG